MNCGDVRNQLAAFVLGDLPEHVAGEVRQHLETCADCRSSEQALRGDLAVVQAALARRHAETPRLTPSRRAAIMEARRRKFDTTRLPVRRILEWAAAAMIMIMLAGMLMPAMSRSRACAYRVPKGSGAPMLSRDFEFAPEGPAGAVRGREINGEKDDSDGDGGLGFGAADINLTGAKPVAVMKKKEKRADVSYEAGAAAPLPSEAPGVRRPPEETARSVHGRDRNGGAMGGWASDGKEEEPAMFGSSVSLESDLEQMEARRSYGSAVLAGGGGGRMGVGGGARIAAPKPPEARIAGGRAAQDAALAYSLSEARPNAPAEVAAEQPAPQTGLMGKAGGPGDRGSGRLVSDWSDRAGADGTPSTPLPAPPAPGLAKAEYGKYPEGVGIGSGVAIEGGFGGPKADTLTVVAGARAPFGDGPEKKPGAAPRKSAPASAGSAYKATDSEVTIDFRSVDPTHYTVGGVARKHDENGRNGKSGGDVVESVQLKGIYASRAKGEKGPDIQVAITPVRLPSEAVVNGTPSTPPPPPSDHDTVAMTTETRQRIDSGLAAEKGSASESKLAPGGNGYGIADFRILEGKLNLAQKKLDEARRIQVGTAESQKVIEPGRPFSIQVDDRNLSVVGASAGIEVRVWTRSGDEEFIILKPRGDSKTAFEGEIPTAPGVAAKGDRTLQVLAGDQLLYDFSEKFKEVNKVASEPSQLVTVISDKKDPSAELAAQSVRSFQESAAPEPIYPPQVFNPIIETRANPFSTFGIDVDTASFTVARRYLLGGRLPPPGAIRVEEFVNALEYAYKPPERAAFAVYCDRTRSPFRPSLEVLRIGVRGKVLGRDRQRALALTFVVDTSGSMNTPDRLELAQKSMNLLLDNLMEGDSMAIVAFGSEARLVLDRTNASRKDEIRAAIASLQTYGSTHLEGGIRLGYEIAARRYQTGLANRVMIFSDGVANLGAASSDEILKQVEAHRKQGIFCSVFGLGAGAYNDAMLQALADKGDGVYRYLDSVAEAKRVLVDEAAATLQVIAKDMKIQVEFSPERVKAYRQIGYEKRHLEKEQFRDDTVDAGEVGSGQSATALYEIETAGAASAPLGVVRLRWKDPDSGLVTETAQSIQGSDRPVAFEDAPSRFRLAVGAAELADWLRDNPLSAGTEGADIRRILQTVGSELSLDRQVQDVVRMAAEAARLKKGVNR